MVYLLSSLPSHQKVVHEINSILYDFLWDSKGDKINRTEIINDYDNKGGLKMIDIQSFHASLKTKWVQSYLNTENKGKWKALFGYYLERYGGKLLFLCNLKQKDASQLKIKHPFLTEIEEYWSNLNYREKDPLFESTCIRHNSLITIDNKPFFYKSWFKAGVENVKDLLDEASRFIDVL